MIFGILLLQAEGTEIMKTHNWLLCPKGEGGLDQQISCHPAALCEFILQSYMCVTRVIVIVIVESRNLYFQSVKKSESN